MRLVPQIGAGSYSQQGVVPYQHRNISAAGVLT